MRVFLFLFRTITFVLIFLIFISPVVSADIYMYIDKDGVRHFTNIPMASENASFDYRPYLKATNRKAARNFFDNIDACIIEASTQHDVSFSLIKAIIKVESDFNPEAISQKGAMGLMQIMPFNFNQLSITDPFDPWENIMGGVRYLKNMLNKFNGNLQLSLAAYNAGPGAVDKYGCIPPYPETISYIDKVLKYYNYYQNQK
ncbi:MAG: lytic transglycosylase domain-containing protein [Desulfobacterales bacterium]